MAVKEESLRDSHIKKKFQSIFLNVKFLEFVMKENEKHLIKYNLSMSEGSQNIDLELTNESIISNFLKVRHTIK